MKKLRTLFKLIVGAEARLLTNILSDARRFYRISFVATAFKEDIYRAIGSGSASVEVIAESLGINDNLSGLKAWLDLGVSLGELSYDMDGYRVSGRLSRQLLSPSNDPSLAFLLEISDLHDLYIKGTPRLLREGHRFPLDAIDGPLIARSSLTLKPLVSMAVEQTIPKHGDIRLLEIGCGSAIYIRQACVHNPSLIAVGLESDPEVAEMAQRYVHSWLLEDRVSIDAISILDYESNEPFDLATLHNNIYYFPVSDRVGLLRKVFDLLKPGGRLLITTGCQDGNPVTHALNITGAMTEGMGVLPEVDGLLRQLERAGFTNARNKKLIPIASYYAFQAVRERES
jgi:SAM-dependent methyltransferase